ncbi:PPC domain-containing DNA-binding protein [Pedobacter sp. Leaf250]|uniref:PPC domain-containing DNA-binding protein n=1 Tax=Pedobacter sp. Leaf250 TaxID=2876559 RepID=UPI001E4AC30D|nr:PPC domain-containing DNA-binding protein [Pedobacter sp. Leaf250]
MKKFFYLSLLFLGGLITNVFAQTNAPDTAKRYIKTATGFLMVLRQGDDVLAHLENFAVKESIPSASYSGMGFVNAKFGFFNFKTKEYEPEEFKDVELASMSGSIAWQNGKASLHTHGTVTGKDFKAYGGHLLAATVGTGSVEITIIVHQQKLERIKEEPLGANVLNLSN